MAHYPTARTLLCTDCRNFERHTDQSLYDAYDVLAATPDADYAVTSQMLGIKVNPHGLMHDPYIRTIYKPVSHMVRDWMHMLVSNGVANIQIARMMYMLTRVGIGIDTVSAYVVAFNLQKNMGRQAHIGSRKNGSVRNSRRCPHLLAS